MEAGRSNAAENGGTLRVSHDIDEAYRDADVVYAKSWGALPYFGRWEAEKPIREQHRHFIVDEAKMALTRRRHLQPLPAAAPQRQGHRRGDGLAALLRHRRGREPPARAEGGDGEVAGVERPNRDVTARRSALCARSAVASSIRDRARDARSYTANRTGIWTMTDQKIVLAFSGGLDTSFCVPWLQRARLRRVHAVLRHRRRRRGGARLHRAARAGAGRGRARTVDGRAADLGRVRQAAGARRAVVPGPVPAAGLGPVPDRARSRCKLVRCAGHEALRPRLHRHGQRPGALRRHGQGARRLRDRGADPRDPEGAHRGARLRAALAGGARLRGALEAEGLHDQRERARR